MEAAAFTFARDGSIVLSAFLPTWASRPPGTSLDRIDNNGPYAPDNCKWSTLLEQSRNKRRNGRLPDHLKIS